MIKILLSTFIALIFITCQCSSAQSPSPPPPNATEEYLAAHNEARKEVNVGPLQWSPSLAKSASLMVRLQRDKQNCSFANLARSQFGGNQLWSGGHAITPRSAVETWVEEKKFYTYENNSCAPEHHCGVYTQVVWKKSEELGCANAVCVQEQSSLTICFYNPPGNIVGEKPY